MKQSIFLRRRRRRGFSSPVGLFADGETGFWYDFSRTDLTWQDAGETTLADDAGETVALAKDVVFAAEASQATEDARPTRQAGGLLRFDGTNDRLQTSFTSNNTGQSLAVRFSQAIGSNATVMIGSRSTTSNDAWIQLASGGLVTGSVGTGAVLADNVDRSGQIVNAVLTWDTSTVRLYVNGAQVAEQAKSGTVAALTVFLGTAFDTGLYAAVDLYQALAINRVLTPGEVFDLHTSWATGG